MNISIQFSWKNHSYEEQCSWHAGFGQEACMGCLRGLCVCLEKACVVLCAKFWLSIQCLPDRDWVTAVLLSGCGQAGWMVMLLESFAFYVLWGRNRREPSNWKKLSLLTVHSLHASSGEKGEINLRGPKRSFDPMGWWSRATSNAYFVHYAYSEAGKTSLQASFC